MEFDKTDWPETVTVMKVVTYTVSDVYDNLVNDNTNEDGEVYDFDFDRVMEVIESYAKDDFSCGWGHEANIKELIFQDENGNEL